MKLWFFLALCWSGIVSAVIEAPFIGFDYAQNPSHIEWKHIKTDHFDIIFPESIERDAQRVAHLLEKAYPYVARSLEVKPPRIPVILQTQTTDSNGLVTLAPRRSEWMVTPTIDPVLSNTEWLKTLAIHEFRHVVQFHKTRRGFNDFFEILLGEAGQALGLGLTVPPWFLEGDAVGLETALTRGGRGRLPLFERDLRTLLLSGKEWNYDKAHLGSYEDYVPNHYVYGYFYTSWLRNQYGDLFLSRVMDTSADSSYNPLTFYNSVAKLTNKKFESFYRNVMRDLVKEWQSRLDKITLTPYEVKSLKRDFGWTNYLYPQALPDGKILALKYGLSYINHFVVIDGKKEKTLFYPGPLHTQYPFKVRNGKLAFFELEYHPRWGVKDYSKLRVYDLKKEKFILTVEETKGRLAIPDHEGKKIAFVIWNENQEQFLVTIDLKGRVINKTPYPSHEVITGLDWLSQEELVLVTKNHNDLKSISSFNLNLGKETVLKEKSIENIGAILVEDGVVLYESPLSGIDNIWALTDAGPVQLTSSRFGAYAPDLKDGQLIYNDYSVDGMNVVTKSLPWKAEQKSEGSFYPIYEKFAKTENLSELETKLSKHESYKAEPYSQVGNSVNLHSWVILAPPLSSTVTLVGLSRDVLNNFTLTAGGLYDLNEQTIQGFAGAAWTHYYPVFDIRAAYGNRRQDVEVGDEEIENKWEEGTFEAGVSVPWRYIQGRFNHSFTARAFSRLIKVTNKISNDIDEVRDGALFSPGGELSYAVFTRFASRDINPRWGLFLDGRFEEGRDITGVDQKGSHFATDSRYFLPGLIRHHSFYHQFAYERQRDEFYQYSSFVLYPRGTRSTFLQEFTKYSANYLMPLFYPDWNWSRYLYVKRISLNLFYDELNGRVDTATYHAASLGWEAIFEMHLLRIFLPFSVGVRGSYILDGLEKDQNYEIFLATVLGTF